MSEQQLWFRSDGAQLTRLEMVKDVSMLRLSERSDPQGWLDWVRARFCPVVATAEDEEVDKWLRDLSSRVQGGKK